MGVHSSEKCVCMGMYPLCIHVSVCMSEMYVTFVIITCNMHNNGYNIMKLSVLD